MKLIVVLIAALTALVSPAQPGAKPRGLSPSVSKWGTRLAALDPSNPESYFLLGEEVAAEIDDSDSRELAAQLYVLAFELQRASGSTSPPTLGHSVCLALAAIAKREDERRWLVALADTQSDHPGSGPSSAGNAEAPEVAMELATAMGLARAGEGRRAEQLLEKPEVDELLTKVDSVPMPDGSISGLRSFLRRAVRDWPVCPQCRNRRVVPAGANRTGEMTVCDTCRGNPGPKLTDAELANQLRIEAVLLQGSQRSWAAQILSDAGAPLRDLDPSELAGTFGVDPTKPVWRDGHWAAREASVGK